MTNIAIFCDGTWNNRDKTAVDTVIGRLEPAARDVQDADGKDQLTHYEPGPGADAGLSGWQQRVNSLRGGLLGRGLTRDIQSCFEFLVKHYSPGDRIFIFGFSRGAYTARSLAGLLRTCGIPEDMADVPEAMRWYRDKSERAHPASDDSHALRLRISSRVHTSAEELDWRRRQGAPEGVLLDIAYLGIFDTVGAHGVGGILGQFKPIVGGHGFHDHDLSRLVQSGRHAVGLDETRVLFRPTKWTNLDTLNKDKGPDASGGARYRQEWFPGNHSIVGGGGLERGIADYAVQWVFEGAAVAGLRGDLEGHGLLSKKDHMGALTNGSAGFDLTQLIRFPRRGPRPGEAHHLNAVALRRLADDASYRPASLRDILLEGRKLIEAALEVPADDQDAGHSAR